MESEEIIPVSGEGWRRERESDVLETGGTRISCSTVGVSWKMEVEGGGLPLPFLPFFLFFPLFPDASTMEETITSPNKKSGNKLHWRRMLGWIDAI